MLASLGVHTLLITDQGHEGAALSYGGLLWKKKE
jgi:hypothetical protein